MLRLLSQLQGQLVLAQTGSEPIGKIGATIIEPNKGAVVAYELATRKAARFISVVDVLGYFDEGLIIRDADAVEAAEDLVRLTALLADPIKPIGLPVVTDKGHRLGKAADYLIETVGHTITKLHVKPGLLSRIVEHELILPRDRIVRITPEQVVVRYDTTTPAREPVPAETAQ